MSVPATSPRRATFDAIAIALALLAVDAFVLLLFRDDVADALAAGTQNLLAADDAAVRHVLDELAKEGWTVEHDVSNARGILIGSLVQGPSGAYIVEVRNRAYRLEHLRRARPAATACGSWAWSTSPTGFASARLRGEPLLPTISPGASRRRLPPTRLARAARA